MGRTDIINLSSLPTREAAQSGKVWIVSAGPGDPDLLTVKALRILQTADVILYDNLVSDGIRKLFPRRTPAFYVGKTKGNHSIPQQDLNRLLLDKAGQGLQVCRLKGGDAFVFGRGGEEMLELREAAIEVEVVPGVTAASGCSAYAGIPLTHRGVSQGVTLVTAHAETHLGLNWAALAGLGHTLVFYMGLSKTGLIREQLLAAGMSPGTPAALIENGCCPQQRVVTGQLHELPLLVERENLVSPALIVVGDVVSLAERLSPAALADAGVQIDFQQIRKLSA